ncbi:MULTISPECIES: hypothetical protein [Pseudomonas]|uniref:hypothetical protein n=1 Tax=Pseudomonas TaxID=286 RepID=UPI001C4F67C4|nr:hypothetical protein [Pseudomonas sp. D1HM]
MSTIAPTAGMTSSTIKISPIQTQRQADALQGFFYKQRKTEHKELVRPARLRIDSRAFPGQSATSDIRIADL